MKVERIEGLLSLGTTAARACEVIRATENNAGKRKVYVGLGRNLIRLCAPGSAASTLNDLGITPGATFVLQDSKQQRSAANKFFVREGAPVPSPPTKKVHCFA